MSDSARLILNIAKRQFSIPHFPHRNEVFATSEDGNTFQVCPVFRHVAGDLGTAQLIDAYNYIVYGKCHVYLLS
jgi:hypothetical protein